MPYYTEGTLGDDVSLLNLPSSTGESAGAAFDEAMASNPTVLGFQWLKLHYANQEQRMAKPDADNYVKQSGVKVEVPDEGMSKSALDILIERRKDEVARQSTLSRAPSGFIPSTARGAATIGGAVLDPLNIATAFVPVVGEARYAQLLATAAGGMGRLGVRLGVGALEGAVGTALLEPLVYAGHSQLQDDYNMSDSLMNIAFGAGMGAGLHGAAGAVGDALGISRYAKDQQQRLLDAANERLKPAGAELTSTGLEAPTTSQVVTIPENFREPIYYMDKVPEAPFPKRGELTPEAAIARAIEELKPDLIAATGGRMDAGAVASARQQLDTLDNRLKQLDDPQEFKQQAKDAQSAGASRKEAETIARKAIADEKASLAQTKERIQNSVDTNAKATQAEQALAELDKGNIPPELEARVSARADELTQKIDLAQAVHDASPPAFNVIAMADQSQREAAIRAAIAHAASGRMPEVGPIFGPYDQVSGAARVAAEKQAAPESVAVADFKASAAADAKLKAQPKSPDMTAAAEQAMNDQFAKLDAALNNLKQRGFDGGAIAAIRAELKPFDDAVADSDNLANALQAAAVCGLRA